MYWSPLMVQSSVHQRTISHCRFGSVLFFEAEHMRLLLLAHIEACAFLSLLFSPANGGSDCEGHAMGFVPCNVQVGVHGLPPCKLTLTVGLHDVLCLSSTSHIADFSAVA